MALNDRKITGWAQPIVSLDDKPKLTAAALKAAFDSNSNELKPAVNGMIDDLTGTGGAGEIGVSPVEGVSGTTVQAMLAALKALIDLCETQAGSAAALALKADKATVAKLVETVAFNAQTGVFTITEQGGTVHTIDTVLEKVPMSCRLDGQDFVLTLEDGTEQRVSLAAFLTPQEFVNSDTVQFEVAGNTIRAKIKSGSIDADMLTGTILDELKSFRDAAAFSAAGAAASEQNAAAYKTAAARSAQAADEKAAESGSQAALAQSYAVGGTGTRTGEDTDNAKYYRDQALLSATQAGTQAGAASAGAARAEAAARGMGVHIGADRPGNSEKIWLKPVDDPLIMNPNRATADMTQEVAVDGDGRLVTKPTTMQGTLPIPMEGDVGKVPAVNAANSAYTLKEVYAKSEADVLFSGKIDQPYASAEGAFIHIADSAGGMLGGIAIRGNSVQDGTPSPDAPVEIESVQSPVALTVYGANSINDTPNAAVVNRGVTFSAADGGGTMIVGTSTATFAQSTRERYGFFRLPAGTYTAFASVTGDTGGATIAAQFFSKETNAAIKNVYMGKPTQIVLDGGLVAVFIAVYEAGVTLDCVVRVMLVPGEIAAPYEPYAGQAYSIPLVAADAEAYPEALELCRIGDVCDSLERRDGVWGVNKAAGQDSPLWIPLSDEAQAVLDSIRLPAGAANIFATNSPAPELELTYRKTVISLPTPDTSDAGKVPVVGADGTGYELIFRGSELLADITIAGLQELRIRSIDYETGVMELTEPLAIGSDGATLPGGFGGWGLGVDITKLQSLKNSVPKELLQKFGGYFSTTKRVDETHIQITDFSSLTEPSALDLDAFWIAKSTMVTLTDLPEFQKLRFHVSTNGGTCTYIRLYDENNSVIYGYCGVQSGTYGSYNTRIPAVSASGLGVSEGVLDGNSTLVLSGRSLGFNAAGSFVSTLTEQNYAVFDREKKVKKIEIRAEYGQMLNGSRVRVWKEA